MKLSNKKILNELISMVRVLGTMKYQEDMPRDCKYIVRRCYADLFTLMLRYKKINGIDLSRALVNGEAIGGEKNGENV